MGFLDRFLDKRKIFLGLYEENFLNSEEFLRAAEDFSGRAGGFFSGTGVPEILNIIKRCKEENLRPPPSLP